jgi:hypothetical protein
MIESKPPILCNKICKCYNFFINLDYKGEVVDKVHATLRICKVQLGGGGTRGHV